MRNSCWIALRVCWISVLCACLTGCFDVKQEVTLNPDGSGKVVMESTFAQTELLLKESRPTRSEEAATFYVRKLVEEAQGVDAWRDISFRELEDGRLNVRGTAYFRDFSKFRTSLNPFVQFKVTKDAADQLTIALQPDTSQSPIPIPKTNEPVTAELIQYERKQFRAAQPWLAATLGTMKQETTFRFQGVVRQASNLQTTSPQSLRFSLDGARLMKALEDFMRDPEFTLQRLAASSGTNFPQVEILSEKLYGQRGPVRAVILPGGKPLFDYAAEVAEARKSFPAMAKELGLAEPPVARAKPAVDGATASIRVNGIGWRFDEETPLRSLSGGLQQGYTLSLRAELPGPVFNVDKVEVTRAATLEGVLLKARAYFYGAVWIEDAPFLTTNVNFDVYLGPWPSTARVWLKSPEYWSAQARRTCARSSSFPAGSEPARRARSSARTSNMLGSMTPAMKSSSSAPVWSRDNSGPSRSSMTPA